MSHDRRAQASEKEKKPEEIVLENQKKLQDFNNERLLRMETLPKKVIF